MYGLERFGIEPGLSRMEGMMELLGHPEKKLKTIHISGTNGKGSVAAMLDSVLRQDGDRKVGLYTSPHLYRFNERIQVGGRAISDVDLARHVEELRGLIEKNGIQATFFEFTTAVAIAYFVEREVDVVVMEVGLGGLLDATNVVEPIVSVITNIGLDHTEYLGDSKEEIANEKAGIIKDGAPVITAETDEKLLKIFREKASEVGSNVYEVGNLISPTVLSPTEEDFLKPQIIAVKGVFTGEFDLPLLGSHQVLNAATVLSVLHVLNEQGFDVSWEEIQRGMSGVRWEGRLQVVSSSPLVLVDGAHNNDGVEALYEFIKGFPRFDVLVLGEKVDKDMEKMTELIVPLFAKVVITKGVYMAEETHI